MKKALKVLVSVAIIAFLFSQMDRKALLSLISNLDSLSISTALGFMMIQVLLLALRWRLLTDIDYFSSLKITVASGLASSAFLTSIGGVVVRIGLSMKAGMSAMKATCATVTDRAMTFAALVILALFCPNCFIRAYYTLPIVVVGVFTYLMLGVEVFENLIKKFVNKEIIDYLRMQAPENWAKVTIISVVAQICFFAAIYALCKPFDGPAFPDLLTVIPLVALISVLPVSIGGWGMREGAFVYGLGLLSVPMESAFIISVQVGILSTLSTLFLGPILFIKKPQTA